MRHARSHAESREVHLFPSTRVCSSCEQPLRERYHKRRFIVRLDEQLTVLSHFLQCRSPECPLREAVYRPEQEGVLALRGYTFGLDVVARIGELRFARKRSIPEIHDELTSCGVAICEREVSLLAEVFLALVSASARSDPDLIRQLHALGGLILSIDGVQPEKGNETLYLIRELQSGRVLVARSLRSSATPEIERLIEEVEALGIPILGVVSDKQESICLAIARRLPKVPHQLCQYHYLRDMAMPVADADRHLKKEVKKKTHGLKAIETSVEGTEAGPEREAAGAYCAAIRVVMRQDGKYPLVPSGLELVDRLTRIRTSIERAKAAHPSRLLDRLARLLSALDGFAEPYARVLLAYGWIWGLAHRLESDAVRASTGTRHLIAYVEGLEAGDDEELGGWLAHMRKLTHAFAPRLFEYKRQPLLPKTNNELELFIGRLKTARRHATGRKNTQEYILREGQYAAVLYGLPAGASDIAHLAAVDVDAFRQTLKELRRREERSQAWRIRRDLDGYLHDVENLWPPPE